MKLNFKYNIQFKIFKFKETYHQISMNVHPVLVTPAPSMIVPVTMQMKCVSIRRGVLNAVSLYIWDIIHPPPSWRDTEIRVCCVHSGDPVPSGRLILSYRSKIIFEYTVRRAINCRIQKTNCLFPSVNSLRDIGEITRFWELWNLNLKCIAGTAILRLKGSKIVRNEQLLTK